MEGEVLNLENRGNCLFCKIPPAESNPVAFYSVRTLLQYLQMNQVKNQTITVDLNGSEVNAGLCKGCGDLVKRFLEAKQMMESCLVAIQTKMEVGRNGGMEYPYLERIIMKMALETLTSKKHSAYFQDQSVSEISSTPADVPYEVVTIEESEDEAETPTQDSDSVPIISGIVKMESSVPHEEYNENREVAGKNKELQKRTIGEDQRKDVRHRQGGKAPVYDKRVIGSEENEEDQIETRIQDSVPVISKIESTRRRKMPVKLSKARGQIRQRAIGVGQGKDTRQATKAPAHDKGMVWSEEDEEDQVETTKEDSDSVPIIAEIVKIDGSVSPKDHSNAKQFQFSEGGKKFSTNQYLKQHILSHSGKRPWSCKICGRAFSTKFTLIRHKGTHTKEECHSCKFCEKRFTRIDALTAHISRMHTYVKPYKCTQCSKTFSRKRFLNSHLISHSDVRAYKCRLCEKDFKTKYGLGKHVQFIHEKVRNHQCIFCKKKFGTLLQLNQHSRSHTNERPYLCKMCDLEFKLVGSLYHHMKTKH